MAKRAGISRRSGVVMKHHPHRHAEQQHDEDNWNNYPPILLLVKHSSNKGPSTSL
jgi:hypothetical protein